MSEIDERIAVLESRLNRVHDDHDEIMKKLDSISDEMTKYKGFLGGVAFIVSSLLVAITFAKDWIKDKL